MFIGLRKFCSLFSYDSSYSHCLYVSKNLDYSCKGKSCILGTIGMTTQKLVFLFFSSVFMF